MYCLVLLIMTKLLGERPFQGDVEDYWAYGEKLWETGRFSLNIDGYRGYVFPLCLGICNQLGGVLGWMIINSIFVTTIMVYIVPELCGVYEIKRYILKATFFLGLFLIFGYGTIVNPSSDIVALGICLTGQMSLNKAFDSRYQFIIRCLFGFVSGGLIYCAYNVRTIYMFATIWFIIDLTGKLLKDKRKNNILVICAIVCGAFVSMIPQMVINFREYGIVSPEVKTNGLFTLQLLWGLKLQRYDTTLSHCLGTPRMCFVDRVGMSIIQKEGITDNITYIQYFKLFFKYPIEMISIYMKHFCNLLCPIFPENFVRNIDKNKIVFIVPALFTIYGFIVAFKNNYIKKGIWRNFMSILIPIVFIIPGSVEQRYGMGIFFTILAMLCFATKWEWKSLTREKIFKHIVFFSLMSGMFLAIWTNTMSSLQTDYPPEVQIDYPIFFE